MSNTPDAGPTLAPPGPREEQSHLMVLISGLATTVLALLGVYLLNAKTDDFHIMGLYADYVLPVGALIVGVAAASGYGLASWFSGIKITRRLLWTVLLFQLAAYCAAEYIEFSSLHLIHRHTGQPVGFLEYYDLKARTMAWKQDNGQMGEPMGGWGYFFRLLEVVGFAGGGLIVPVVMRKAPYCQDCQRYMHSRQIGLVPASIKARRVKKSDAVAVAAYQGEQQQAYDNGKQTIESLQQLASGNKSADFQKILGDLTPSKKQVARLPGRFSLHLVHCRRCYSGWFAAKHVVGQGNRIKSTDFARTDLHPEFIRSVAQ